MNLFKINPQNFTGLGKLLLLTQYKQRKIPKRYSIEDTTRNIDRTQTQ